MIKNLLRRIRKFFGLLDLKGEINPYPLNSSPEIHVNTFSAYPDAYGNFEDQPKKNESVNDNNKTHYFHEDSRVFDGGGIISQIDSSWPNNDSTDHSSDHSSGSYDTDSSSSSNDSSDW